MKVLTESEYKAIKQDIDKDVMSKVMLNHSITKLCYSRVKDSKDFRDYRDKLEQARQKKSNNAKQISDNKKLDKVVKKAGRPKAMRKIYVDMPTQLFNCQDAYILPTSKRAYIDGFDDAYCMVMGMISDIEYRLASYGFDIKIVPNMNECKDWRGASDENQN